MSAKLNPRPPMKGYIKPFWTDEGVAIVLWCVYHADGPTPHYHAAFADLPDAENYAATMQRLNPKRRYEILAE